MCAYVYLCVCTCMWVQTETIYVYVYFRIYLPIPVVHIFPWHCLRPGLLILAYNLHSWWPSYLTTNEENFPVLEYWLQLIIFVAFSCLEVFFNRWTTWRSSLLNQRSLHWQHGRHKLSSGLWRPCLLGILAQHFQNPTCCL